MFYENRHTVRCQAITARSIWCVCFNNILCIIYCTNVHPALETQISEFFLDHILIYMQIMLKSNHKYLILPLRSSYNLKRDENITRVSMSTRPSFPLFEEMRLTALITLNGTFQFSQFSTSYHRLKKTYFRILYDFIYQY